MSVLALTSQWSLLERFGSVAIVSMKVEVFTKLADKHM